MPANPSLLAGLKPGSTIDFEFVERKPGEWVITTITPRSGSRQRADAKPGRTSAATERNRHAGQDHRVVGAQRLPRAAGDGVRHAGRHLRGDQDAARRAAGPLRRPGHHLHRVPRPGAAGGRGPGHLSADHRDAVGAEVEGRARLLVLRRLVRLRHLRGRHRHLLGALARARVPELRRRPAAARRDAAARARRHRRRLGLPVRGGRRAARTLAELRTIQDWYLRYQLAKAPGRRRGRQRRRLRAAVPGHRRPDASCAPTASRSPRSRR